MAGDLRELLRHTAQTPTRPLDTSSVVRRARRQVLVARFSAGLAGLAVLVTAALFMSPLATSGGHGLEIADRPVHEGADERLWGRSFVSVEVTDRDGTRDLVPGTRLELELRDEPPVMDVDGEREVDPHADGFVTWHAGCNRRASQGYLSGDRLELNGFGHTTLMLCSTEELAEQDR